MNIKKLEAEGLLLFESGVFPDSRGYFMELFKETHVNPHLPSSTKFVQDNLSWSQAGVIRGLHLQTPPHEQGKLVRCLSGRIYDVVVDLRVRSKAFKKWFGVELDSKKNQMLYVPVGFAHGFLAIEDSLVTYKCTTEYAPKSERGLRYNDHALNISWPNISKKIISEKDLALPLLSEFNFDELQNR